jgi:hypothetical protein
MKNFDIEAYLDAELEGAELTEFEQEMRQNQEFAQQVEVQRKLTQHLRTQMLREQVGAALSGNQTNSSGSSQRLWLAGVLLLIGVCTYFFMRPSAPTELPTLHLPPTEQIPVQPAPQAPPANTNPKENQPVKTQQPIATSTPAQAKPRKEIKTYREPQQIADLRLPDYPAPQVRGENADNSAWKAMLDQIWYTDFSSTAAEIKGPFTDVAALLAKRDFTNAFVQLEMQELKGAANDTLSYLKGYCLLELGEGTDAVRYFEQIENQPESWKTHIQWYRGLGLLSSGDAKKAVLIFKEIASTPNHPYRKHAQKALDIIK